MYIFNFNIYFYILLQQALISHHSHQQVLEHLFTQAQWDDCRIKVREHHTHSNIGSLADATCEQKNRSFMIESNVSGKGKTEVNEHTDPLRCPIMDEQLSYPIQVGDMPEARPRGKVPLQGHCECREDFTKGIRPS